MSKFNLSLAACATALIQVAVAQERSFELNVPRQAAVAALQSLARATNTEVIFSPEQLDGVWTQSLGGRFTLSEALSHLLEGSGLKFTVTDRGTIIVTRGAITP